MGQAQAHIEEIRARLDIVSWIGGQISLKKAGRTYKGLCPFHSEKSPSFIVNPERQTFHCFGCGVGGDIFAFTMKHDNLTFIESLKKCASAAQVELPQLKKGAAADMARSNREQKRFLRINQLALEFFQGGLRTLPADHMLPAYLTKRALSAHAIDTFKLGYAPNDWQGLTNFLNRRGVPLKEAAALGLVRSKEGRFYDFFRHRLIFPIVAKTGEVIGFGGRQLAEDQGPKYLNSPESPVYHKGAALYGVHWSEPLIQAARKVFIVEGYMDAIRMIDSGFPAVAPLGTALTPEQLSTLKRYGAQIYLLFDGDMAGFRALLKSVGLCLTQAISPSVISLPDGDDPDSFIQKNGGAAFAAYAQRAPLALDFLVDWLRQNPLSPAVQSDAISLFLQVSNPIERLNYLGKIAAFFGTSVEELKKGFAEKKPRTFSSKASDNTAEIHSTATPPSRSRDADVSTEWERRLIHHLCNMEDPTSPMPELLRLIITDDLEENTYFSPLGKHTLTHIGIFYDENHRFPQLHEMLDESNSQWLARLLSATSGPSASDFPVSAASEGDDKNLQNIDALLKKITFLHLKNKLRKLTFSIEQAERQKDITQMATLLEAKMKLLDHLKYLKQAPPVTLVETHSI